MITLQQDNDNRLTGDTPLKQTQLVLLHLLKVFAQICDENSLTYWIDSGTLLGAVRHKGFIPWDDDVDVIMPLEDYRKFCSIAEGQLPVDIFFQTPETDVDYICPWVKLRDRYSHLTEAGGPYPYSQAISIDIFPVVYVTQRQSKNRFWYALLPPYNVKPERLVKHLKLISKCRIIVQSAIQWLFIFFTRFKPLQKSLCKWFEKGELAWEYLPPIRWKNRFPDSQLFPLKKIIFEDTEFWAPNNAVQYLTDYYGDFMTPPPEEKRVSEHAVTEMFPIGPNPHFSARIWESSLYTANDITVVIPCYNAAETILSALNSIVQQTVSVKEVIIVDDGSTDNSVQLCSQWASSKDIEVKIISQKNSGVSFARNTGIRAVQTSLIAFLDSDDSWIQTKIEKQLKIINSYSKVVLVSTGSNILPTTDKTLFLSKKVLLKRNRVVTSSVLIKTDVMKQNLFNTTLRYSEDYNVWLKLACSGQFLLMLDSELIHYSTDRENKLSSKQIQFHKNEIDSFKNLKNEHYISVSEFLGAVLFSNIKYIKRILFPRRLK